MKTRQNKCKQALFTTIKTFILIFGIVTNAKADPQYNMYTPRRAGLSAAPPSSGRTPREDKEGGALPGASDP